MIELEVYARGLRSESHLMELRSQMELLSGIRYKVDAYHDLVYFELEEPVAVSLRDMEEVFTNIGLTPRFVGQIPEGLA